MIDLLALDREGLRSAMKDLLGQAYRGDQVRNWIYRKGATSFDVMTNLSENARATLAERCVIGTLSVRDRLESASGDTVKWLFETADGEAVETVLIRDPDRRTACISTQIGCPLGCRFCASAAGGYVRDLTVAEIVEQALRVKNEDGRLTNVVVMGMGEPLLNVENTIAAIHRIHAPWALNVGARRTTVSTAGIVPGIRRLAEERMQWKLAISLHAPFDTTRRELMPITRTYPIAEVIKAARGYARTTGTQITYEYILIPEINMRPRDAHRLVELLKNEPAKVNLIPMNPVSDSEYSAPSWEACVEFQQRLKSQGVVAMIRKEHGQDIDAACGQLRRRENRSAGDGERR